MCAICVNSKLVASTSIHTIFKIPTTVFIPRDDVSTAADAERPANRMANFASCIIVLLAGFLLSDSVCKGDGKANTGTRYGGNQGVKY